MIIRTLREVNVLNFIILFFVITFFGCAGGVPILRGTVKDISSGAVISGAQISTDDGASTMSISDGTYFLSHPAGIVGLTATKTGYDKFIGTVTFVASETVFEDIAMTRTCTDNDGDGYGNPGNSSCRNGSTNDCNDNDANIYPEGPEVRIGSPPAYYRISQFQTGYDSAGSGANIQSKVATYIGNFTTGQNKNVTIKGGYDCGYTTNSGTTIINGNMNINSGTVTIEGVKVQ